MHTVQLGAARIAALFVVLACAWLAPAARAADFEFNRVGADCYCRGIGVGADGSVYGADSSRARIVKWSRSGAFVAAFDAPATPYAVAEAPGGALVVADSLGAVVLTPTGQFVRRIDDVSAAQVAVDGAGNAYLTSGFTTIRKVAVAGGPVQQFTDPDWRIRAITFDPRSGHLFAINEQRSQILELRTDGTVVNTFSETGTGEGQLNYPRAVAVGPDGSIYVAQSDYPGPPLKRFDAAGHQTGTAGEHGGVPDSLVIDGDYLIAGFGGLMRALDLVHPTLGMMPSQDPIRVYAGALVRFSGVDYSHISFERMTSFAWDFDGDGTTDLTSGSTFYPLPSYRYPMPGTYRMTMAGTAGNGGSATLARDVVVTQAGVALTSSPSLALTGAPVTLDASKPALPETGIDDARWDLDGNGSYEADGGAAPTIATTFATPGTHTVRVRLTREGGVVDTGELAISVHPAPPPGHVGVSIEDGARYTNDPHVTLDVTWPAGADTLLAASDGGFRGAAPRGVAARVPFTLDESGPERLPKTVYVRFDAATQTFQDEIILDQTNPAIQSAQVAPAPPAGARAAAVRRHSYRVHLRAKDKTSGVAYVQFATRRSKPSKRMRYHRALTVRATQRPVYVRVRDRAGNNSRWRRLAVRAR